MIITSHSLHRNIQPLNLHQSVVFRFANEKNLDFLLVRILIGGFI